MDEQRILENLDLFWFFHNILAPSPPSSPCLSSSSTTAIEQTHLTNTEVSVKKDSNYPKHSKTSNPLHQTQNRGPVFIKSLPESSLECNYPSPVPAPNLENGAIKIPETSNRSRKKSRDSGSKRGTKGYTYVEYKEMKGPWIWVLVLENLRRMLD